MKDDTECFEFWTTENGNRSGDCCCNCKWQRKIMKHPWNKIELFKGSIMSQIAWGCTTPELDDIYLSECEHGMCEMHQRRD